MRTKFVHFGLTNGFIDNWLAAGPQVFAVSEGGSPDQIARRYADPHLGIDEPPVERGPLAAGVFTIGDYQGSWDYYRCGEDHRVDQSAHAGSCAYLRSWAYTQLYCKEEKAAELEITSPGPLRVWLNGAEIILQDRFAAAEPARITAPVALKQGRNELFVRFEALGAGFYTHYFTARVLRPDSPEPVGGVEVHLPSQILSIGRRNRLEKSFHSLYLERDTFSYSQQIALRWPPAKTKKQQEERVYATVRLMNLAGRIHAEAQVDGIPGDRLVLGIAAQYPEGRYDVLLMPRTWEYYDKNLRITHKIPFLNAGRRQFAESPVGTFGSRKLEALEYAGRQEQGSVEREMARMALERWDMVDEPTLMSAAARVKQLPPFMWGEVDGALDLLALLAMVCRYGGQEQFPRAVKTAVEEAAQAYPYDAGGSDSNRLAASSQRLTASSYLLSAAACRILAGQLYADCIFLGVGTPDDGQTGTDLRQAGEQQALQWMRQRAAWGFAEFASEPGTIETLAALAYLIDLAETEDVWEMAAALMDKLLFTLALNTFKGLYGGPNSLVSPASLKGGLMSPLSGVSRLMWGQGIFTPHLPALVALAANQEYQLPNLFVEIATQPPAEFWGKERHAAGPEDEGANQAAYKTPDYLLSSAQAYKPGERGRGEHVWQATLGPEALVFTNHPGASGESDAHLPGFWRGNGALPCIAQWKDALLCIYHLPEGSALDYTHAYFPTFAFDEYQLRGQWAFARKGDAYLALAVANPVELIQSGPNALRELRSRGLRNAWFCQMGRAARDGSFADFQQKAAALPFAYSELPFRQDGEARFHTLAGDRLALRWPGDFRVNDARQPLSGFPHYDNLYTTVEFPGHTMEINTASEGLRLHLE